MCQVFIFCPLIDNQYVETDDYDYRAIPIDMDAALSSLRIKFKLRNGKKLTNSPDDLFQRY